MAENINIDFMPNRKTSDIQRVTTVEDYLKLLTDRTKFCFTSVYDDFADMGKRIEYLENYSLAMPSSVDLTVENAVILQETESQQVIHNFTKTHYVKGNNIGYGGVGNSFVLGGYLVTTEYMKGDADYLYSEINFPKGTRILSTGSLSTTYANLKFYLKVKSISTAGVASYNFAFSSDDEEIYVHSTASSSTSGYGIGMKFYNITPPDSDFECGSADVEFYYSNEGDDNYWTTVKFRLPFQSEAEYNAAVGLTNTPLELIKIQDFQYLMPESQIIIDKALSEDSDNVIANSTVAKALTEKADKETVENLSLEVDSKADIIEVEALTELVNEKADKSEVKLISQAVEGKAESSALTSHTGNTSNPHNVTKAQIGLDKVENKSSADILSELQVGGTQILRGTNTTTTLGAASGGSTWETGGWRIASSTTSGIYRESIVVTDAPNANIRLGWKLYGGSGNVDIAQDNVPVASGNIYTLSCYARGNGILRLQYGKNPYVANNFTIPNTTTWTKHSMTFVANETEGAVQNGLTNIYIGRTDKNGDSIEICGMKLETGNKATDWSPAPEDMIKKEDLTAILTEAKSYTDAEIAELINAAPSTLDTLGEIANAMQENANVVEALESAIGNKAEKSEVELISQAIDNKADIAELEALAELVNDKADSTTLTELSEDYNTAKTDFDSRIEKLATTSANHGIILNEHADALTNKAESSDLTAHIDDKANPHEVTKEQVGLDKVENKSVSEILSGLSIGGTQILRNTQTTTLGATNVNALWSEGAWRKASGTNGTWESIDITDCPEPYIEKGWRITSNSATITISQNNIPLVVGEEYILSVYAKGKGSLLLNTVATAGGGSTTSRFDIDSEKWTKYSHIFTAQAFAEQSVYIGVQYQGDSIEICGMKLEIGNKATSWNVCPKDIANHEERIATLEAALLSLGGET